MNYPLQAGTAEEFTVCRQREMRRQMETQRPETHAYAFTEMLVLEVEGENEVTNAAEEKAVDFATSIERYDLQHASTEQGEAFTAFARFILKQTGLTRLLWGMAFESESKVILFLDWQTTNAPKVMHNTPSFQQARQRLEEKLMRPIHSQAFDFWGREYAGRMPRSELPFPTLDGILRVAVSFQDPGLRDTYQHADLWQVCNGIAQLGNALDAFLLKMFQRQGGRMGWSKATESGSDDSGKDIYCGAIALRSRRMLQDELALAETLSYEEEGIKELRGIAAESLDVFHMMFLRPNEHSLGPHNPPVAVDMRGMYPRQCCTTPDWRANLRSASQPTVTFLGHAPRVSLCQEAST